MSLGRRGFLKVFGIGIGTAAVAPLAKKAETVVETYKPPAVDEEVHPDSLVYVMGEEINYNCSGRIPDYSHLYQPVIDSYAHTGDYPQCGLRENNISFFMNDLGERGQVVSVDHDTGFDRVKIQQGNEQPVGILMNDVVGLNLRYSVPNLYEVQQGCKVQILTRGIINTKPVGDPRPGDHAMAHDGVISNNCPQGVRIGTFLSGKDQDGFAKISISQI